MFIKARTFFTNNSTELAATPIIGSTVAPELNDRIEAILEENEDATADISGSTEEKNDVTELLISSGYGISGALVGYYTITAPDKKLAAKCQISLNTLKTTRDLELYTKVSLLHEIADPIKALLGPFGITSGNVDGLGTLLSDYLKKVQSPQDARGERSASNKELQRKISDTGEYLETAADAVMKPYYSTNRELYDYYLSARAVDQSGGGAQADFEEEQEVASGATVVSALDGNLLNINSGIRIKNKSLQNGAVLEVYFASAPGVPAGDTKVLQPGQTYDALVAQIGYGPTSLSLEIKNSGTPAQAGSYLLKMYY